MRERARKRLRKVSYGDLLIGNNYVSHTFVNNNTNNPSVSQCFTSDAPLHISFYGCIGYKCTFSIPMLRIRYIFYGVGLQSD